MSALTDALKRFNRKERNWLINDALGEGARNLCPRFRARVVASVRLRDPNFEISPDAWWATDFHIDWIIGALTLYIDGEPGARKPRINENYLIKGNQQDIDLIIASGSNLIMIEAKGVGSWKSKGTESKINRLINLTEFLTSVTKSGGIKPFLIFCSPGSRTLPEPNGWPDWMMYKGKPMYVQLNLPAGSKENLHVERCSTLGTRDALGTHWRVV